MNQAHNPPYSPLSTPDEYACGGELCALTPMNPQPTTANITTNNKDMIPVASLFCVPFLIFLPPFLFLYKISYGVNIVTLRFLICKCFSTETKIAPPATCGRRFRFQARYFI